jgi:hypothetical protein
MKEMSILDRFVDTFINVGEFLFELILMLVAFALYGIIFLIVAGLIMVIFALGA